MADLVEAFLVVLFGVMFLVIDFRQRRENRRRFEAAEHRRQLADKVAARLADGLPPHIHCLCAQCRAWRTNPRNAELLRLRGLR